MVAHTIEQRQLVERYATALERADMDGLLRLMRDDVALESGELQHNSVRVVLKQRPQARERMGTEVGVLLDGQARSFEAG